MATEFSLPKAKRFPYQPRSPVVARLMQSCAFILAVNWCLQGMRGMDRKELGFRLGSELIVVALLAPLASVLLTFPAALMLVPFANLLVPLFSTAYYTHIFKSISRG